MPKVLELEVLEGQLKLTVLNKKLGAAFVKEIIVYAKNRIEIKWKFRDEFGELEKIGNSGIDLNWGLGIVKLESIMLKQFIIVKIIDVAF